jgi:hypothetical protein
MLRDLTIFYHLLVLQLVALLGYNISAGSGGASTHERMSVYEPENVRSLFLLEGGISGQSVNQKYAGSKFILPKKMQTNRSLHKRA